MPGVQIPTLNRFEPQAPESNGQINTAVADTSKATGAIGQAAGSVINEVADYQAKVEQHAIETAAVSANNNYEVGERELLGQARKILGDPTDAYHKIDSERQARKDAIIAAIPNITPRMAQAMREKFSISDTNLREKQATQSSIQYETYKQKTFDDGIAMRGQGVLDASEGISSNAPVDENGTNTSLKPMTDQVSQIRKLVLDKAIMDGQATKDKDGNIALNDTVKLALLKATDGPVKDVVDTFNRSGKPELAKMVMDKFGDNMLSKTKAGLLLDHKESVIKVKAAGISEELLAKYPNPADRFAAVDKLTDPLEKQEVRKNLNIAEVQKENNDKQAGKYFSDKINSYIQKTNADPDFSKHLTNKDQIDNNQVIQSLFKAAGTRLDPKARNAIIEDATGGSNKVSSPSAYVALQNKVADGTIADMSESELVQASYGLNSEDRKFFKQKVAQAKDPASADNTKRDRFMTTNLKTALRDAEMVVPTQYNINGGQKYSVEDENQLYRMYQEFAPIMEATHDKSETGQLKAINGFVAKMKVNDTYKKVIEKPAFQGSLSAPADVKVPELNAKSKQSWLQYFREDSGHALGAGESLTDFIKSKGAKLPSKYSPAGE
jgi:hypothetical protein